VDTGQRAPTTDADVLSGIAALYDRSGATKLDRPALTEALRHDLSLQWNYVST